MISHNQIKKAAMFVDGENVWMYIRERFSRERPHLDEDLEWEDFILYLETLGIDVIVRRIYIVPRYVNNIAQENFLKLGFEVIPTRFCRHKTLTDSEILVRATQVLLTYPIDVLIVVSGDKDYEPLARLAKEYRKEVIFASFPEITAELIKKEYKCIDLTPFVKIENLIGTSHVYHVGTVIVGGDIE